MYIILIKWSYIGRDIFSVATINLGGFINLYIAINLRKYSLAKFEAYTKSKGSTQTNGVYEAASIVQESVKLDVARCIHILYLYYALMTITDVVIAVLLVYIFFLPTTLPSSTLFAYINISNVLLALHASWSFLIFKQIHQFAVILAEMNGRVTIPKTVKVSAKRLASATSEPQEVCKDTVVLRSSS